MRQEFTPEFDATFSCDEISYAYIVNFCDKYIECASRSDRRALIDGLVEVCKTPTGRASLRATENNIRYQRQTDPNYKIKIDRKDGLSSVYGGVDPTIDSNTILLFPDTIRESVETTKDELSKQGKKLNRNQRDIDQLVNFQFGATFLHEAQHVRQMAVKGIKNNSNLLKLDAGPQALSRQLAIESNQPIIRSMYNVSEQEYATYLNAVIDPKTNQIDPRKAQEHSKKMQRTFTRDFLSPFSEKPSSNHGNINAKWIYHRDNILKQVLLGTSTNSKTDATLDTYIRTVNLVNSRSGSTEIDNLNKTFRKNAAKVLKHCSKQEREALYIHLRNGTPPTRREFATYEAYSSAVSFFNDIEEINRDFQDLSYHSVNIHNGDKKSQEESKKIIDRINKKYGIKIPRTNKKGEQVATNNQASNPTETLAIAGDDITKDQTKTLQPVNNSRSA